MTKYLALYSLALFVIVSELYCCFTSEEMYPFSNFPMYKKALSSENHFRCSVFIQLKDSKKLIPYYKAGSNEIEYLFSFNVCRNENDARELSIFPQKLENYINEYVKGIKSSKRSSYSKIIVKAQTWDRFEFKNINNPDKEIIVYEKLL